MRLTYTALERQGPADVVSASWRYMYSCSRTDVIEIQLPGPTELSCFDGCRRTFGRLGATLFSEISYPPGPDQYMQFLVSMASTSGADLHDCFPFPLCVCLNVLVQGGTADARHVSCVVTSGVGSGSLPSVITCYATEGHLGVALSIMAMAMHFVLEVQSRVWKAFGGGRCLGSLQMDDVVVSIGSELQAGCEYNRVKFGIISTDGVLPVDSTTVEGTVMSFLSFPLEWQIEVEDTRRAMLAASEAFQRDPYRYPIAAYASVRAELSAWISRCSMLRAHPVRPFHWNLLRQFLDAEAAGLMGCRTHSFPLMHS